MLSFANKMYFEKKKMVYNVWSEIQQTVVEQSPPTSSGTLDLTVLSIPILISLFLALLLTSIAIFGQTERPTMAACGLWFFEKGNSRAYSLILAATIFAFVGFIMSPINIVGSSLGGFVSMGQPSKVAAMWLDFAGVLLCFVAAIILAVVVTPYKYKPGYRQSLAKYGGFGVLLLSFLALLSSYILQKVDTQGGVGKPSESGIAQPTTSGAGTQDFSSSAMFPDNVDKQMQALPLEQFKTMIQSMIQSTSTTQSAVNVLVQHMSQWPASATDKDAKIQFIKDYFRSPQ